MTKKTKAAAAAETPASAIGAPTTVLTVTLDQLEHDPIAIDGHEKRLSALDDLLASLPVKGQLQSLKVRPSPPSDVHSDYWVTAGNRRLAALRALQARGGAVQGVPVTGDFPVHVIVSDETDADAYESSRSENLQRLPETPVEEFRAFARMAKSKSVKEIAAVFGCPPKRVEQRLRLAALHDDVLEALEKGKITMEAAQAFTLEPDPERQAAYLKKSASNSYALSAGQIKEAFTQKLVRGDSALAQLITRKAYVAAGGQVLGDAFDEGGSYWISPDVVERLAAAAWSKKRDAWLEEGWSFVETADEFTGGGSYWKIYQSTEVGSTDAETGKKVFTAEDKAKAGVVYWPDANREPRIGVMRYKDRDRSVEATAPTSLLSLPYQARQKALASAGTSIAGAVSRNPELALKLMIATIRFNQWDDPSPVNMTREFNLVEADSDPDAEEPEISFSAALADVAGKQLPELLHELSDLLAMGIGFHSDLKAGDKALFVLAGVAPTFDPEPFFAELTKPFVTLCWQDMTGEAMADAELGAMRQVAAAKAFDTGWLPPQIRTASYSGPAYAPKDVDDDADEGAADDDLNDDDSELQAAE